MKQTRLLIKTVKYSINLIFSSSNLMILLTLLLSLIDKTLPFVGMYIMKNIFDELTTGSPNIFTITICVSLYIVILLLTQTVSSANSIILNSTSEKAEHKFDVDLSEMLVKLPMDILDTSTGKDLIDEIKYTKYPITNFPQEIIAVFCAVYAFIISFIGLLVFNVWFSFLFILLSFPGTIINIIFNRKRVELRRNTAPDIRKFSYYRWMLTDAWPAKDVRMYDLTEPIKQRYDTEKEKYRNANKMLDLKGLGASLLIEIIKRSGEITFTAFIIFQAINGNITVGDITLYIGFALSLISSFQLIISTFSLWYTTFMDMMKRFFEFMEIDCHDKIRNKKSLEKFESLIFDNVYFKYPLSKKYVLNGISFSLNNGEKLSIVGINGAGKSTIIKLMLGFYQIDSGQILINGYLISDYDIKDVRKLFSVFFQSFVQYPLTLRENIILSDLDQKDNDEKIIKSLIKSGAYDNYDKFKNGLNSNLTKQFDDNGIELSIGQWQKIALSRTYFKDAFVIIFDEPSSSLDVESEEKILKEFKDISENKTGIIISHRMSSAKIANKIIVIDDGKIIEDGTHEELISLNGLYTKLYNLQMEKYIIKEY